MKILLFSSENMLQKIYLLQLSALGLT